MSLLDALLLTPHPFNVWIAKRTDGIKGSGTASDPYDGSTAARLDAVLASLPVNTHVHLGAGSFDTNGYAYGVSGGWQIKAGMKIEGSGIGVTTLKLANHTTGDYYFAISHDISAGAKVDFCEVSDLTIDCNLAGAGASTACGAVRLMGEHVKIARVKAVNWGSKDSLKSVSILACVTALLGSGITDIPNAGIEDCIVINPGAANVGVCTALTCGNPDDVSFVTEGHGKAPYIRHCFVDCMAVGATSFTPNPNAATARYRGVSMSWCRGGVIEGNQIHNTDIGGPYLVNKQNTRDIIVRNNFYRNVGRGPFWNQGGFGSEAATPTVGTLNRSGTVGTVTNLNSFEAFQVGTRVKLNASGYDGVYIIRTQTPTSFTITVPGTGSSPVSVTSAKKVFGVNRAIIEGNSIELPLGDSSVRAIAMVDSNDSSPYSELPDYVHEQLIVRNNKIRYVDGAAPNDAGSTHIELKGIRNAIVQDNVLDTMAAEPIQTARCGTETYFDNRTATGEFVGKPGFTANDFEATLQIPSDDAFVLSLVDHR